MRSHDAYPPLLSDKKASFADRALQKLNSK